jgi:hypothetical protein
MDDKKNIYEAPKVTDLGSLVALTASKSGPDPDTLGFISPTEPHFPS